MLLVLVQFSFGSMCLGSETSQTSIKYSHEEQTGEHHWNLDLRNMFSCCCLSCHSVASESGLPAPTFTLRSQVLTLCSVWDPGVISQWSLLL